MSFEIDPNKQYILAGDISASMEAVDAACGDQPRYDYMLEKFKQFIKVSEDFDPDGPTVLLFGEDVHTYENTTLAAIETNLNRANVKFEGWTNTDKALAQAYELHKAQKAGNATVSTVLLVFTDGAPTNRKAVEQTIRSISDSLDRDDEFSISFLTVGTIDQGLQEYLVKLDDELTGVKFDIVDVKKLEEVDFLKAVAGAIND